jgi:hypothetical protein
MLFVTRMAVSPSRRLSANSGEVALEQGGTVEVTLAGDRKFDCGAPIAGSKLLTTRAWPQ